MGISKLKIPKICPQCGKPFEAKSVTTLYCSHYCGTKASREKKKKTIEEEQTQNLLQETKQTIATIQSRPYITVAEAVVLFGISKKTMHRLIKSGKIPAVNLGERLTRVSRAHIEAMFPAIEIPEPPVTPIYKTDYKPEECYTIGEISEKFGISLSTVDKTIRKRSIPKKQVGKYVYVPKEQIDSIFNPNNKL